MGDELWRTINSYRKAGQLQDAWDAGCPAVQEKPDDSFLKGSFFWVCYDFMKQVQASIKLKAQENNGNHSPNTSELDRVNFLLDWIIWLKIPSGGFEYRSLLMLFQKNLDSFPKLVLLLVEVGPELFNEEDGNPYQNEHGESPSLMLKFSRHVAKAWMDHPEVRQIDIDRLLLIFDQVRQRALDKQNLIWLDYDEAKCLIISGRYIAARELVKPVLLKKQTESWAWAALATTYRKDDQETSIVLFCKGLSHAYDEKFALPLLKGLAPILANQGCAAEASMCVKRAVNCYEKNGWRLKADVEDLTKQPWFDSEANPDDLTVFIEETSKGAIDLLHGPSKECVVVISNIHKSGKGFHVYRDHNRSYSVRLGLYKSKEKPVVGDYVRLVLSADGDDIIAAESCGAIEMTDVKSEAGELEVTEKGFGFVNDTFIPPSLIEDGMGGKRVSILKVLDFDKSKNRPGWKAISLEVESLS